MTMNDGSRSRVMSVPCRAPMAAVAARPARTADHHGQLFGLASSSAMIIPPTAATKPVDRSISLSSSAKISASPSSTKTAAWVSRLMILPADRKTGS